MKAMKLKYILGAVLSAFIFAGCSDDDEVVGTFGDINVSQSYLSIPETGGSTKVTVRSAADWKFGEVFQTITKNSDGSRDTTYNALPAWLSADVLSGGAGETVVTFSADATNGGREAELQIVSGEHTQFIKVRQGEMTPVKATIAEISAAPAGKSYRVSGVVTRYYGNYEQYGNYYIKDATGEILVYGTADKDGKLKNYPMKSWGIEIGDEITIEGATSEYKGVNQFVDVTVVSLKKGLLQVVGEATNVSKEGGNIEVKMGYKGNGAYFSIPEDVDWIKYLDSKYIAGGDADTIIYSFSVAPNEGGAREAQITFTSSKGKDKSEINYTVKQETAITNPAKGDGSKANPYNVPAVLEYVNGLGADVKSESDVYVEGIISSIKYTYSAQFGTATYNISVDGNEENIFTVYGSYFFDNKPWEEGQTQIQVGDKVVVCGKVINYKGTTPEFSNKENWLVSLNGVTGEGGEQGNAEAGTQGNPYDVEAVVAVASKLEAGQTTEEDCYFKGKISSIKYTFDAQHGTATFFVSNDGSAESTQFQVYSTYYLGNRAWADGDKQIAVGDEVVICGKLTNYNGTLETASKKSYIYSLNGATN